MAELYAGFCSGNPEGFSHLESRLAHLSSKESSIETARRTANLAAVLIGLQNGAEEAWRLLIHREDPTARSFLIERLGMPSLDPRILEQRLASEPDVSARSAILLAPEDALDY